VRASRDIFAKFKARRLTSLLRLSRFRRYAFAALDRQRLQIHRRRCRSGESLKTCFGIIFRTNAIFHPLQPPLARISDTFGRQSLIWISVFFWCLGTIVEACSDRVEKFAAGACLHQVRFSTLRLNSFDSELLRSVPISSLDSHRPSF
jgi:hypothetical protein